jgi:hypothetical protein
MGILDKLMGKKQPKEEESKAVCDGCTIMLGDKLGRVTRVFRERGIQHIINCWSTSLVTDLIWPEGSVNNITVCMNHAIPIGVINYDKWYGQVFMAAGLNRLGREPEMKITCTPSEKVGMILLHWNLVDQPTCLATLDKLDKGIIEWS